MEKFTNEQMGQIEDNSFNPDQQFILANKEDITDFFGNNRNWYAILRRGGQRYGKTSINIPGTSLNSKEYMEAHMEDEIQDLPPLDIDEINEGRAKNIANFFIEYPEAKVDLLVYLSKP